MKKRVALYVRVSTQEQKKHGLSVDSQIAALEEYCAEKKYTVVDVYNDAGISARKKYTKRPGLLRLLNDMGRFRNNYISGGFQGKHYAICCPGRGRQYE